MQAPTLFPLPEADAGAPQKKGEKGAPRLRLADRAQVRFMPSSLDGLLPDDHQARAVWAYVERLDLTSLLKAIDAVEGNAGRPATDPRILLTLWLYATIDAVGSARALERLCESHVAYRWICGGVSVRHTTLSSFRTASVEVFDRLLTESVAVLRHKGLVTLQRVAQDGMRVRASAGAASFRRKKSLKDCLRSAKGELPPMVEQIAERYGQAPGDMLADGGFVRLEDIETVEGPPHDCEVYAPVPKPRDPSRDPHAPRPKDKEHVAEWRRRMGTEPAKEIYKERAATAECVNAIARNRGLRQFAVRGLAAVKAVALLFALAHNVARAIALA